MTGLSFPSTTRLVDDSWQSPIPGRSAQARGRVFLQGVVVMPVHILAAVVPRVVISLVVVVVPNEVAAVVAIEWTLDGQFVVVQLLAVVPLAPVVP